MADYVGFKFSDNSKNRRQIIKQLLAQGLIDSTQVLNKQR